MTLSGLLDVSYNTVSGNGTNATTKLNNISTIGSATSAINLNAVEDLGGGLKGQVFVGIDPRGFVTSNSGLTRHEAYIGLSGGFGNLRMGAINTASLSAFGAGSPLGTANGSAYGNIETAAGGAVRFNNSLRYDTPRFNGFAASLNYAPGNNDAAAGGAVPQVTDLGLSYVNGPLTIQASSLKRSETSAQAASTTNTCNNPTAPNTADFAGCGTGTAAVAAMVASTYNTIGANYTMGAMKVFAGYGKGDNSTPKVTASGASTATGTTVGKDSTVNRIGASYTMGAVTLLGQYATLKVEGEANKRKATGFRADYALSKRTVAYTSYEAYTSSAASSNKINTLAVGVRHSF